MWNTRWQTGWTLALLVSGTLLAGSVNYLGKPDFEKGADRGYFLWKDGKEWKIRWTTYGASHHFTGSLHLVAGSVGDIDRVKLDERKRVVPGTRTRVTRGPGGRTRVVRKPGAVVVERKEDRVWKEDANSIRWTSVTSGGIDGFDFKVNGRATAIRFVFKIDGKTFRRDVWIGSGNQHPGSNPFTLRLP